MFCFALCQSIKPHHPAIYVSQTLWLSCRLHVILTFLTKRDLRFSYEKSSLRKKKQFLKDELRVSWSDHHMRNKNTPKQELKPQVNLQNSCKPSIGLLVQISDSVFYRVFSLKAEQEKNPCNILNQQQSNLINCWTKVSYWYWVLTTNFLLLRQNTTWLTQSWINKLRSWQKERINALWAENNTFLVASL